MFQVSDHTDGSLNTWTVTGYKIWIKIYRILRRYVLCLFLSQ